MNDFGQAKKIRFPDSSSFGLKPISKEGSIRLFDAALKYALEIDTINMYDLSSYV